MKVVDSDSSTVTMDEASEPSSTSSADQLPSSGRPPSKSMPASVGASNSFRPPPPFTAMTAHRDLPGMPQGGRGGVSMPNIKPGGGSYDQPLRSYDQPSRSCDLGAPHPSISPRSYSEPCEPMRVSLSEQLPRLSGHASPEVLMGGGRGERPSESLSSIQENIVDPEMKRLEGKMDSWCLDLKRNVLVSESAWSTMSSCVF